MEKIEQQDIRIEELTTMRTREDVSSDVQNYVHGK